MKFELKAMAGAAALLVAACAQAGVVTVTAGTNFVVSDSAGSGRSIETGFVGGGGSLEFSNGTGAMGGVPTTSIGGLVGALNVGAVKLTAVDGAVITEQKALFQIRPYTGYRALVSIEASVNSLTLDQQSGQILAVGSVGGAQQDAAYLSGVLEGGRVTVRNLRFDLANKTVVADITGQALDINDNLGPVVTNNDVALWTITSISGPTALVPSAYLAAAAGDLSAMSALGFELVSPGAEPMFGVDYGPSFRSVNVLSGLKVTTAGFEIFAQSLGLTAGSTGYTTLQGVNNQVDGWGSIKSTMYFGYVPEPSTYALMGVGLVGISLMIRRRQDDC